MQSLSSLESSEGVPGLLSIQMMWSGYRQSTRVAVLRRVLTKRDNDIYNLHTFNKPIYRVFYLFEL